jgi:signal transduction histidine kinase
MSQVKRSLFGWKAILYIAVCMPMVLLLLYCVWDAYCDVQMIHKVKLRTEISRLRSQAVRRAGQLELVMSLQQVGSDWNALRQNEWLHGEWTKLGSPSGRELYAAVVDPMGTVVLHSDPTLIGRQLGRGWYENTVPEAGDDVVRTENGALADQAAAFDVRVPLMVSGREVGEYHEGLDAAWFDREVDGLQRDALRNWLWAMLLAVAVDVVAGVALYRIATGQKRLIDVAQQSERERATQLACIASGLAHEIRNPLHALRLNLHALGKAVAGKTQLSQDDLLATIRESDSEINELEGLLRDLIRFASPDSSKKVEINVVSEVQATLNLMHEDMQHKDIEVRSHWAEKPVIVWFDPARLRQMLVNLLTFAQNNAGSKGRIEVQVNRRGKLAEVVVSDSGPALSQSQVQRVFEPFQAPRDTGSGLGLALVQTFAAEAGGSASCEVDASRGNRFRVLLPDTMPRR